MAIRLTPEQWKSIQTIWEFDLDEPSHEVAAFRAAAKHNFKQPNRSGVHARQVKEGWTRKGNMNGINQAAQLKADLLVTSSGEDAPKLDKLDKKATIKSGDVQNHTAAQEVADREQCLAVRTEVTVRHRKEWGIIGALRNEAFTYRDKKNYPDRYDLGVYSSLLKACKLAAEITAIQQTGERRAWGMDMMIDPITLRQMSDAQLEAIASGKSY
jgi:hypothetical protein